MSAGICEAIVLSCLGVALLWRRAELGRARRSPAAEAGEPLDRLRPAELAYMSRCGDMSHTMIVLVADLVHKTVKSGGSLPELAPYEQRLKDVVVEGSRRYFENKVQALIPSPRSQSAAEVVRRLSLIYRFIVEKLRPFLSEAIADPRNLRRYFQPAGILRLLADIASAGYREPVAAALKADLFARGLIVRESGVARLRLVLALAALAAVAGAVAAYALFQPRLALFAILPGALSGVIVRLAFELKFLIPLYNELADVVGLLQRGGFRFRVVSLFTRAFSTLFLIWFAGLTLALLACQVALIHFALAMPAFEAVPVALTLTLTFAVAAGLVIECLRLEQGVALSERGLRLLAIERQALASVSPLASFRALLVTPAYDPEFSKLLAIYGIETLWLLA